MEILLLGVLTSAFTQFIKSHMPNQYYTLALVGVISLALAGIYCALIAVGYWETVLQVITIAGAVYTFIIQRFESPTQSLD